MNSKSFNKNGGSVTKEQIVIYSSTQKNQSPRQLSPFRHRKVRRAVTTSVDVILINVAPLPSIKLNIFRIRLASPAQGSRSKKPFALLRT